MHDYLRRRECGIVAITFSTSTCITEKQLHVTYQRLLSRTSFGNALYWPIEATKIVPECVGYFNENGQWKRLNIDIKSDGSTAFAGDILTEDTGSYGCDLIASSNVQGIDFDVSASAE